MSINMTQDFVGNKYASRRYHGLPFRNQDILTRYRFIFLLHTSQQRLLGRDEEYPLLGLLGRADAQLARQEVNAAVRVLCAYLKSFHTSSRGVLFLGLRVEGIRNSEYQPRFRRKHNTIH